MQQWTQTLGRAQQLLLEHALSSEHREQMLALLTRWSDPAAWAKLSDGMPQLDGAAPSMPAMPAAAPGADPAAMAQQWAAMATGFWQDGLSLWQSMLAGEMPSSAAAKPEADRRFQDADWQTHPIFAFVRQSYALIAERLLAANETLDGSDPKTKAQMRFVTEGLIDALSPSNFAVTNPAVLRRTVETRGENLVKGLEHMLADLRRGQMTHVDRDKFEVGVNIAATPGKVVHETPLFQLIHYAPTTEEVLETPLVIFPPWINRFYILDLNPQKSFVRWALDQGISVFMVSWKSADASIKDVVWDDYIAAEMDAIKQARRICDTPSVHAIGYCVAGTTLAAALAILAAQGKAERVASATFFTAQVDFSEAGDLSLMVDERQLAMIEALSGEGWLDGRYMAATFNALRGRDLIWNYVVNNYLLGEDYPPFDLLYWNGDTTNLPAKWHKAYLTDLYRDNRLVVPGAMAALGTPIDLTRITTPAYVQAGREDHIAPPGSVFKMMHHLTGPKRFVLAGSGHIAGVVNPPAAQKYQYWTNDAAAETIDAFVAGATETKGSWWPDWLDWLRAQNPATIPAKGSRKPGKGRSEAIEDAPGRYVRSR